MTTPHDPDTTPPRPSADDIFGDALELPEDERAAFVARACGDDASLRSEVESLLAALPGARRVFDDAPHLSPAADGAVGKILGVYRLVERVASGGMGEVYRGERVDEEFRKQVAVKVIRPWLDTADILERFRTERQVLADLEHPNIARLIDGGTTPDGAPYLVMEFVDGAPIDRHADANRLGADERLRLFLTVCGAVQYAHRNLVVHRDLKPSNIMVDRDGQVKLLDFGIAKVLGADADTPHVSGSSDATQTVFAALTPRYASPEQVRGHRVTTASDVYSLGVLLYELLVGGRPYEVPSVLTPEAARVICEKEPTRPSRAAGVAPSDVTALRGVTPARLAHTLDGDLDTIVMKALRKEPERRYASVDEFAADIRRYLDGLPVLARVDRMSYRVSKFVRRHRALVASVISTVVVLAVALAVTVGAYRRAEDQTREARALAYVNALAAAESAIRDNQVDEAHTRLEAAPENLRGWEWDHLNARVDRSRLTVRVHDQGVVRLLFTPDGEGVVSASIDGTVREWNAATGDTVNAFGPFGTSVESVAMAPDGAWLAAGLGDGRVMRLSRDGSGATTTLHEGGKWAMVDVSPDGARVVAAYRDGSVRVLDVATGAEVAQWNAHATFGIAAWSPRGDVIVTAGGQGDVKVWDARTFELVHAYDRHARRVYCLGVSADGSRLATGSMDRTADVYDLDTGEHVTTFREHRGTVAGLAFFPGGNAIVSSGPDGRLLLWDAVGGGVRAELRGHPADVSAVAVSSDGTRIASADWGGGMKVWDASTSDVRILAPPAIPELVPQIRGAAVDPSGTRVACALNQALLPVWSLDNADEPPLVISHIVECTRVAFTPDGTRLLGADVSGSVVVFNPFDATVLDTLVVARDPVNGLAVHPRGRAIATCAADSLVRVWDLGTHAPVCTLAGHGGAVLDVEFSPRGDMLASCGADSTVRLWGGAGYADARVLHAHTGAVVDVCFAPDGRRVVSASTDATLRVWDTTQAALMTTQSTGRVRPLAVSWSGDGARIAAGGADGVVRIYNAATLREIVGLHGHVSRVNALVFSPGDACLVSTSRDGTVRIWDNSRQNN